MNQDRAICFFDLETTGTDVTKDRIVEISVIRREPDGTRAAFESLVDPEIPIPIEASSVHGITAAQLAAAGAPKFGEIAAKVLALFQDADLAGFNILGFDVPLLAAEFKRVGTPIAGTKRRVLDGYLVFRRDRPHSLGAAVRTYCGRTLEGAHRASADVEATIEVMDAQAQSLGLADAAAFVAWQNEKDPRFVDAAGKLRWSHPGPGAEAVMGFGKNEGKKLREVDRGFLEWMLRNDFPRETLEFIRAALSGKFPTRTEEGAAK